MNHFQDCINLDQGKKVYRGLAMLLHPDQGGDEERFKVLINQWEAFQQRMSWGGTYNRTESQEYWNQRQQEAEADRAQKAYEDANERDRRGTYGGHKGTTKRRRRSYRTWDISRWTNNIDTNDPTNWWIIVVVLQLDNWKRYKGSLSSAMSMSKPTLARKHYNNLKELLAEFKKIVEMVDIERMDWTGDTHYKRRLFYACEANQWGMQSSFDRATDRMVQRGYIKDETDTE